jgi:hypothetical protein
MKAYCGGRERSRSRPFLVLALLAASLPVFSCQRGAPPPAPQPTVSFERKLFGHRQWLVMTIQPVEVDFRCTAGKRVVAEFSAEGELDFNTHKHIGPETILLATGRGSAGEIVFDPPHDGLFSFIWSLPPGVTQPIKMEVKLYGVAEVDAWIP